MKVSFYGRTLLGSVMLAGMFASANAFGATITLNSVIANGSFEGGNQGSGCPASWTCSGSPSPGFTSYTVTAAQYTAGADGLSGGRIVPDGTHAASSPTPVEGSGSLTQTGLGTYALGNTYVLNVWVGTPKTLPSDNVTPTAQVGTVRVYFLGNGSAVSATDLAAPAVGQWSLFSVSYTPGAADTSLGQAIGLQLFVDSNPQGGGSGNNRIANFDIVNATTPSVPEPASLLLSGLGIVGLGLFGRRRAAKS